MVGWFTESRSSQVPPSCKSLHTSPMLQAVAYMQAGRQTDKNNMCTIVVAIIELVDLTLNIRF